MPRRASSPREAGSGSVARYLLSVENPKDSLSIPNQIPALSTGPRNAHISGRTPPLRGPQVSALANCLSEAAGRERARRNPSAEPDPASAVGPRAPPTTHREAGRPAAQSKGRPHAGLRIPSIQRELEGCGPKCRDGEGRERDVDNSAFGHQNPECRLPNEVTRGQRARVGAGTRNFPGNSREGEVDVEGERRANKYHAFSPAHDWKTWCGGFMCNQYLKILNGQDSQSIHRLSW